MTFRGGDLSSDDVKALLKFKVGDIFNGEKVDAFRADLVSAMKRHGHLDANAEVERTLDEKKQAVGLPTVQHGARTAVHVPDTGDPWARH